MASNIDATKPAAGIDPVKADFRANFAAARSEIEALGVASSSIDATKPADGAAPLKADMRANFSAARSELDGLLAAAGLSASGIDLTIPEDDVPASRADVRANFQAMKDAIEALQAVGDALNGNQPFFGLWYGGPACGVNPANLNLIDVHTVFFVADKTGNIDRFRYHQRYGPGYSDGDGGEYTVEIVEADFGTRLPVASPTIYSRKTGEAPGNPGGSGQNHIESSMTSLAPVTIGQPLCMRWTNISSNPSGNYISLNVSQMRSHDHDSFDTLAAGPPDKKPDTFWSPATWDDRGTTRPFWYYPSINRGGGSSGFWWRRIGTPLFGYRYSDGTWGGRGSWGGIHANSIYYTTLSATNHIRCRFQVSRGTRTINRVFVWMYRLNAASGNVTMSLESGPATAGSGNGTVIEEITIAGTNSTDVGSVFEHDGRAKPTSFPG